MRQDPALHSQLRPAAGNFYLQQGCRAAVGTGDDFCQRNGFPPGFPGTNNTCGGPIAEQRRGLPGWSRLHAEPLRGGLNRDHQHNSSSGD
jgi:hypothetical protein